MGKGQERGECEVNMLYGRYLINEEEDQEEGVKEVSQKGNAMER